MSRSSDNKGPLQVALEAHQEALNSQHEMRDAASRRDAAVRVAITSGHSTREIAAYIGVTQRRVQVMARTIKYTKEEES